MIEISDKYRRTQPNAKSTTIWLDSHSRKGRFGQVVPIACIAGTNIEDPTYIRSFKEKQRHIHRVLNIDEVPQLAAVGIVRPVGFEQFYAAGFVDLIDYSARDATILGRYTLRYFVVLVAYTLFTIFWASKILAS